MSAAIFEFADFFVSESDPGTVETVTMQDNNGNKFDVDLTIRRGISIGDIQASRAAAMKTHLTPTGQQVVDGFDDTLFVIHLLARAIMKWPFERNGAPVPVNVANVSRLNAKNAEVFSVLATKLTGESPEAQEQLADFEKPSDVAF